MCYSQCGCSIPYAYIIAQAAWQQGVGSTRWGSSYSYIHYSVYSMAVGW